MRLEITMRVEFARAGRRALSLIERLALRLVCVCVCATLAACATRNAPGPHHPWPDSGSALPPIAVRAASVESATPERSQAAAKAASTAGRELLLSGMYLFLFPVGPLITIVGIPLSMVDGHNVYLNETRCPERVREALGDVPEWVRSTFAGTPVAQLVAEGARKELNDGGPHLLVLPTVGSAEQRAAQLEGAAKESGAATLIVADIRVLFGETAGNACAVKLIAQAAVRVQPVGQPEEKEPRYLISAEQPQAPLEQWAAEPTLARAQLDELLAALGRKLVLSYGDRMGCTERQCDWLVTTRAPTDPSNPVAE